MEIFTFLFSQMSRVDLKMQYDLLQSRVAQFINVDMNLKLILEHYRKAIVLPKKKNK